MTGRIEGKTKQGTLCIPCIFLCNVSKHVITCHNWFQQPIGMLSPRVLRPRCSLRFRSLYGPNNRRATTSSYKKTCMQKLRCLSPNPELPPSSDVICSSTLFSVCSLCQGAWSHSIGQTAWLHQRELLLPTLKPAHQIS